MVVENPHNFARRISDYERISAICWLILGIIQICCIVTALAGIWNVVAALARFKLVPRILARESSIPDEYESLSGYIIIGCVNLICGGVIGLVFCGFDLYVRDQILSNRSVFDGSILQDAASVRAPTMADLDALERLSSLKDSGVLTEAEFQAQKANIL
ncbi:SHOCT domain-containing protein [Acetobacter orientalis]|uniref:SHOCT domain-containing protein n=1 Tax=Acetobacter orientalis TaxID=146474 RepID=UPI0020A492F5|nr:SHOCT domain-containing protein [Acetobacter orientalis]MCP1220364.1 SHOCT domain-containing protein [Acetobacter orientalis]